MMGSSRPAIESWWRAFNAAGHVEIAAAFDCVTALLVQQAGFDAVFLGAGATAAHQHGLPDVGMENAAEVFDNARRITGAIDIPLIVDIDDGGRSKIDIVRNIRLAEHSGVSGVMIEDIDSSVPKHLWNEQERSHDFASATLYPLDEAVARLEQAMAARTDPRFVIIARVEGARAASEASMERALERARAYAKAGVDFLYIGGLWSDKVTPELVRSLGAPLMQLEVDPVPDAERARLFEAGASLGHALLGPMAAYSAFRETVFSLKAGEKPAFAKDIWETDAQVRETVDLPGWTRRLTDG
jgi:2-methylisocitrate lyase-like PEP mutase family enzyme